MNQRGDSESLPESVKGYSPKVECFVVFSGHGLSALQAILFPQLLLLTLVVAWADGFLGARIWPPGRLNGQNFLSVIKSQAKQV